MTCPSVFPLASARLRASLSTSSSMTSVVRIGENLQDFRDDVKVLRAILRILLRGWLAGQRLLTSPSPPPPSPNPPSHHPPSPRTAAAPSSAGPCRRGGRPARCPFRIPSVRGC